MPVKYKLFADYCNILYCNGTNIKTSTQLVQESLNLLPQWFIKNSNNFLPSKMQTIIFTDKNNIS